MITAVNTNALIALLYEDEHAEASETELRRAYQNGRVVITPIVYAELAVDGHFDTASDLDRFFADFSIQFVEASREALFRAGEQFDQYTTRRPGRIQCPSGGTKQAVRCTECGGDLTAGQHIAADFLIGGHSTADCD